MPTYSKENEREGFIRELERPHDRVNPCFMTGKGCVYGDRIEEALAQRRKAGVSRKRPWRGFAIMPFRPNLKVFLENCLKPFLSVNYGFDDPPGTPACVLERGDEVSRPGIVICEGICRRIQEADFIVADLSVSNDNVFYELGLAYGIGQKIVVIHKINSPFAEENVKRFGCPAYAYEDLALIEDSSFRVSTQFWQDSTRASRPAEHTWQQPQKDITDKEPKQQIRLFEMMRTTGELEAPQKAKIDDPDIRLLFRTHIKSHVGLAMDRICKKLAPKEDKQNAPEEQTAPNKQTALQSYRESIIKTYLSKAEEINPQDAFSTIREQIDNAYCLIVRTGESCHPMSYFWLGYAHARGKNVIPITVLEDRVAAEGDKQPPDAVLYQVAEHLHRSKQNVKLDERDRVADLAFDIRAQRHMIFDPKRPDLLELHVEQTLSEMIHSDFSAWSRKRFWEKVLGRRGEVSILTGGLHSKEHNREMIGDWDLRAASELTTYFSKQQYHPKIETPVYQPEYARDVSHIDISRYTPQITQEIGLARKTCIIIASPDVNPLTEIVLGELFRVPSPKLFGPISASTSQSVAIEVVKVRKRDLQADSSGIEVAKGSTPQAPTPIASSAPRAFFRELQGYGEAELRGFRTAWSGLDECGEQIEREKLLPYRSQNDAQHEKFTICAHLVIAKNLILDPKTATHQVPVSHEGMNGREKTTAQAIDGNRPSYLIVLNGVSGPATFALTHVLTGGGNSKFVSYGPEADPNFDPSAASEEILNKILEVMNSSPQSKGVQCFIEVDVGPAPSSDTDQPVEPVATFDWRRILSWRLAKNMLGNDVEIQAL